MCIIVERHKNCGRVACPQWPRLGPLPCSKSTEPIRQPLLRKLLNNKIHKRPGLARTVGQFESAANRGVETLADQVDRTTGCNTCSPTGQHTTTRISRQGEQWVANGTPYDSTGSGTSVFENAVVGKASHNPLIYKERIIGDREIYGTKPPYVWQIGSGSLQTA